MKTDHRPNLICPHCIKPIEPTDDVIVIEVATSALEPVSWHVACYAEIEPTKEGPWAVADTYSDDGCGVCNGRLVVLDTVPGTLTLACGECSTTTLVTLLDDLSPENTWREHMGHGYHHEGGRP